MKITEALGNASDAITVKRVFAEVTARAVSARRTASLLVAATGDDGGPS